MVLRSRDRRLVILGNLLGLGAVAALLAAIHVFLPPSLQDQLACQQSLGRPETLLTAASPRHRHQHLLDTFSGYAVVALSAYRRCLAAGERRWFWLTTRSMLFVVPVLATLTLMTRWQLTYTADLPPSQVFSGLIAALTGFLRLRCSSPCGRSTGD